MDEEYPIEINVTRNMDSVMLSEQDRKLLNAFHELSVPREIETTEDLVGFMRNFGSVSNRDMRPDHSENVRHRDFEVDAGRKHEGTRGSQPTLITPYQYLRISSFGGDSGKGEVTWECFKFEVESLEADGVYMPEQILHGIRKAARGEVAEIIRRLGTGVTVQQVMDKLNCTYGNIETRETIMKKFYSCTQQSRESVTNFASRLEEYFDKAVLLGGMHRSDTHILKGVLYQGLCRDLKQLASYKCDTIADYDRFKIELRKMEAEMREEKGDDISKPCRPAVPDTVVKEKMEKSELSEVKELLKSLNDRIQYLEETQKSGAETNQSHTPYFSRGAMRGQRGGNMGRGNNGFMTRGMNNRDVHTVGRPIAGTTFSPTCWRCNKKGHVQTNCPN